MRIVRKCAAVQNWLLKIPRLLDFYLSQEFMILSDMRTRYMGDIEECKRLTKRIKVIEYDAYNVINKNNRQQGAHLLVRAASF